MAESFGPISRFDVSGAARLRRRVGRAASSLKFIGLLSAFIVSGYLVEYCSPYIVLVCVLVAIFYASKIAKRLRSGSGGAAVLAGAWCVLWAGFLFLDPLPKFLRDEIDIFSVTGMFIFIAPLYLLARGIFAFGVYQ